MTADVSGAGTDSPAPFDPVAIRPAFFGVLVGMALAGMSQTIVSTALPTIVGELGGYGGLSWVVSAYLLSTAVIVPIAGKLADTYGTSRLFHISIAVFALGSLLAGLSTSMLMLIAARSVQGIGGGAIMTVSFTIIARLVPARERGRYQTKVASVFAVTSVAGPLIGGFFVDNLTWRWGFFAITILSGVAAWVVRKLPADEPRESTGLDVVGVVLVLVIVLGLMLIAVWGGQRYSWLSFQMMALSAVCAVGIAVFVWWELRVDDPVVPVRMLRRRAVWTATALGLLSGIAMFGVIVYAPTYLQVTLGVSATASGLLLIPLMGFVLVGSTIGGRVMSRTGRYRSVAISGSAVLTVGAGLLATMGPSTALWLPSLYVGVTGLGIGLVLPVSVIAVQNGADPEQLGAATSLTQFVRKIGSTIGVAVLGGLFNARVNESLDLAASRLPAGTDPESFLETPSVINALPAEIAEIVRNAVSSGSTAAFTVALVVAAISLMVSIRMPDDELSDVQPGSGGVPDPVPA
jgi:EmrB/QacA subfamily drug resistance transporter